MKTIFKALVGSHSHGTATDTSDFDYKSVFMQPESDILGFRYKEQIDINKDEVMYEVRRCVQLLMSANPTILELLWTPLDCIIQSSPEFQLILNERDMFLTKKCLNSFGGFAVAQIKKARGLDKKMNWEQAEVGKKTIFDFAHVHDNGKTRPVLDFLEHEGALIERVGLVNLANMKDAYAVYYDWKNEGWARGLASENGQQFHLSSVPKGNTPVTVMWWNRDGYSTSCRKYKEYQDWLKNRNTQRYVDNTGHGQQIDGKNMMHCVRLLSMAKEIATEGVVNVRRPDREYLLSIRRGEVNLTGILTQAEETLAELDELFAKSSLPDDANWDDAHNLLINVRNYGNR